MLKHEKRWGYRAWIIMLLLPLFMLSGCGGGGSAGATPATPAATLVSIVVTPANVSLPQNGTQQYMAMGTYTDGTVQNVTASVTWGSFNTATATISNVTGTQGLATAIGMGTTSITAKSSGITGNVALTVSAQTLASFVVGANPLGIAIDASGDVWVTSDAGVTELTAGGAYKNGTLANSSTATCGSGIAIDSSGNLWTVCPNTDRITELTAGGAYKNGTLSNSSWIIDYGPQGIAIDASGNLWITASGMSYVIELTATGAYKSYVDVGNGPYGIAIDDAGNIWVVTNGNNRVTELTASGAYKNGTLANSTFVVGTNPKAIAIDPSGNVWVGDQAFVNKPYSTSAVTVLTGSGAYKYGTLINSTFSVSDIIDGVSPANIAIDAAGKVWVTTLSFDSNSVTVLAADGTYANGTLANSSFIVGTNPTGIAIDAAGDVWTTNRGGNNVTKLSNSGAAGPEYFPYSGPQWPSGL